MKSTDFFNILLPASRVSRTLKDIDNILNTDDINKSFAKQEAQAELFVFEEAEKTKPLTVDFIKEISKVLFAETTSWAGKFRTNTGEVLSLVGEYVPVEHNKIIPSIKTLIKEIVELWEEALKNQKLQYSLLTHAYHSILLIRPFFDGNERVAKLFMNYLAVKLSLPPISIAPQKDSKDYKSYIMAIKAADDGNKKQLENILKKAIREFNIQEHFEELSAPATILEAEIEGELFYD